MKKIMLLAFLISSFASAQDISIMRAKTFKSLPTCYKGVQFTRDFMFTNYSPYEMSIHSLKDGTPLMQLELSAEYADMIIDGNTLYVLTINEIEEFNLETQKQVRTIKTSRDITPPYRPYMDPKGFGIYNSKFYVAHEGQGISIIDRASGDFIDAIYMEGLPQDIAFKDSKAYVIAQDAIQIGTELHPAIYIIDLNTNQIIKKTVIKNGPTGSINIIDNAIYIGQLFWWRLDLKQVETKATINGYTKLIFPAHWGKGKPFMDDKNLYYCNDMREPEVIENFKL